MIVLLIALLAQAGVVIGPTDAIAFDYPNADLTSFGVNRFEASWDGGPWGNSGAQATMFADTLVGDTSYVVVPPFTSGTHTVSFRACNVSGCGGGSAPFAFAYPSVGSVPSSVPANVRKVTR